MSQNPGSANRPECLVTDQQMCSTGRPIAKSEYGDVGSVTTNGDAASAIPVFARGTQVE